MTFDFLTWQKKNCCTIKSIDQNWSIAHSKPRILQVVFNGNKTQNMKYGRSNILHWLNKKAIPINEILPVGVAEDAAYFQLFGQDLRQRQANLWDPNWSAAERKRPKMSLASLTLYGPRPTVAIMPRPAKACRWPTSKFHSYEITEKCSTPTAVKQVPQYLGDESSCGKSDWERVT